MKTTIALALLSIGLVCTTSGAMTIAPSSPVEQVRRLLKNQLTQDFKTRVTKTAEGICGADGPSYIGEIQVKRLTKSFNEKTGQVVLIDSWETVKTYGIPAGELLSSKNPQLMDSEACLE